MTNRIELSAQSNGHYWSVCAVGYPERAVFLDAALAIEHALHRAQALSPAVLTIWDRKGDLVETVDYSAPKKTGVNKLKLSLRSRLEGEAEDLADQ